MSNLILPSWLNGFAPRDGPSQTPGLWKGLVGAWVPALGGTGGTLRDVSGRQSGGTLTGDLARVANRLDWVSAADHVDVPALAGLSNSSPYAIAVKFVYRGPGIGNSWGTILESGGTDDRIVRSNSDGKLHANAKGGAADGRDLPSATTLVADTTYTAVLQSNFDSGSIVGTEWWINGVREHTDWGTGFDTGAFVIGTNTANDLTADMELLGIMRWDRMLTPNEITGTLQRDFLAPFRLARWTLVGTAGAPPAGNPMMYYQQMSSGAA